VAEPVQPSLRRLRAFGITPNRELGQNFLIDSNLLGVIGRAAKVGPDDVVLEIGGGLGVLSEYLAEHALHIADALDLEYAALDPAPTKVVANLPYGIAATAILRTLEQLPSATRWVVMVQREVGERLAADPAGSAYGIPSVLAQLAADVEVVRHVSRTVFFPVPNVDSVLVELQRTGPAADPATRKVVQGAFAHRRKALARSLALAQPDDPDLRDRARAALEDMGLPTNIRAERLSPHHFAELAARLRA